MPATPHRDRSASTSGALADRVGASLRPLRERARRDDRARLDAVLAAAADGIVVERDGAWVANATAQRLLGLPDETMPPLERLRPCTPDGRPLRLGPLLPERFRVRVTSLDGRELVLAGSYSAQPVSVVVFRDVTADYRREHLSGQYLRTLLDTIPTPINVVEAETRRVVSTNRAFLELTGLELDDVLGATPPYPWWDEGEAPRPLGDRLAYARVFRRPDGQTVPVELALHEIHEPDGRVGAYLAVLTDLSERRRFEQQLVQSAKLAAIGELAAGVAHEINNPLFAILGLLEFVLRDVEPGTRTRERLELVHETALEIRDIVRALLDFARESSDEQRTVALDDVVRETVQLVRRTSGSHGVELGAVFGAGPFLVDGSPNQLKQVFLNLLANARQALPGGGTISIRVEGDADAVTATVADDGPGIEPEALQRIFDPFYTTKRDRGGTGLGLPVSLGIAERHGGSLTASSTPGAGASFVLRLPRAERR